MRTIALGTFMYADYENTGYTVWSRGFMSIFGYQSYMVTSLRPKSCSWTNFRHYHNVLNDFNWQNKLLML